ncbi:hypothetical protein BC829DRAFT_378774, partial [Chytridium lagenaria]
MLHVMSSLYDFLLMLFVFKQTIPSNAAVNSKKYPPTSAKSSSPSPPSPSTPSSPQPQPRASETPSTTFSTTTLTCSTNTLVSMPDLPHRPRPPPQTTPYPSTRPHGRLCDPVRDTPVPPTPGAAPPRGDGEGYGG